MIQVNGTDAKDIALHFINVTVGRATPMIIKKTIIQAKTLLESGYTKDEILKVITYLIDKKEIQMYSLGYVGTCINNVLKETTQQEVKEQVKAAITYEQESKRDEVASDGESTQRNRDKVNRFGIQPRFREKFDFDLFEGK